MFYAFAILSSFRQSIQIASFINVLLVQIFLMYFAAIEIICEYLCQQHRLDFEVSQLYQLLFSRWLSFVGSAYG